MSSSSEHDAPEDAPSPSSHGSPRSASPEPSPARTSPTPKTFAELGVAPWLVTSLQTLGITRPTPVQAACIPAALSGRDVIGAAETGTGKTAAFAVPILQALAPDPFGVFAAVLTPTRELAFQIAQTFRGAGARLGLRAEVLVGGVDELSQAAALARRPHVVVGTPGRLALLLAREPGALRRARFVVVDEADRMLEDEYVRDLAAVLDAADGEARQTLMFSATMTPAVEKLHGVAGRGGVYRFDAKGGRECATVDALRQEYVFTPVNMKETQLVHLLKVSMREETAMVFVSRCDVAERLLAMLRVLGMRRVAAMHSEMAQARRIAALQALKAGTVRALIVTDVASRGLDIPAVQLVVNYDLPRKPATYVHRVGRTARAGRDGLALSFVAQTDVELVHAIEAATGVKMAEFGGRDDKGVMEELGATLKARQVAQLEIEDSGFMDRYNARREPARVAAKKRKRTEQRKVERARRRQKVAEAKGRKS